MGVAQESMVALEARAATLDVSFVVGDAINVIDVTAATVTGVGTPRPTF